MAVIGGTGFVGAAIVDALAARGCRVTALSAPRLRTSQARLEADLAAPDSLSRITGTVDQFDVVVNAAGRSDSGAGDLASLLGANALLPGLLAQECARTGARFIHISSAAVQGRRHVLDDSVDTDPATPYARSKAEGERLVRARHPSAVIYRPPGVHGPDRRVTRSVVALARSRFSTVAAPGTANTPQALVGDVADAVAFLAVLSAPPPGIVHHPSSGLSTGGLLSLLGGHPPRRLPPRLAHLAVACASALGRWHSRVGALARRVEVLWFGQEQAPSWLTDHGWSPSSTQDDWRRLGDEVGNRREQHTTKDTR